MQSKRTQDLIKHTTAFARFLWEFRERRSTNWHLKLFRWALGLPQEITVTRTSLDFLRCTLTHKGKKNTTKHSTTAKNSISGKLSTILLSIPLSWNMLLGEGAAVLALLDLKINRNKSLFWTTLSSTGHKSNCHIPYNCHGHIEECSFLLGAFKNVLKLNLSDISELSFTLILLQKLYQTSL